MKKIIISITVMCAMFTMQDVFAQSLEGYKAINLKEEFNDNAFTFFTRGPILLSGDTTAHNAMTIGWGSLGNYLGYNRLTVSVYVAPARYTYEFMERYPRFTIMEFDDDRVARYMGSHSGRDGDKAAALGLHVAYTPSGTPYYTEAKTVIECEIITAFHQQEKDFRNGTPRRFYENFEAGIHTVYIGEIIGAWRK
jgi:flavin reductase (DIM6/NTAB) family NADH-FMN oxidoreductase RutF